jgi:hypothetical protein
VTKFRWGDRYALPLCLASRASRISISISTLRDRLSFIAIALKPSHIMSGCIGSVKNLRLHLRSSVFIRLPCGKAAPTSAVK